MILPSPSLANLAPALVAAQFEMPTVPKTATGQVRGNTNYRYADLDAIWETIRVGLHKHGLAVSQFPCTLDDGRAGLATVLIHTSGEWLMDEMPLATEGAGPQAQGSGITYARRYALCAVLGIVADEDDDGQAAQPRTPAASSRRSTGRGRSSGGTGATAASSLDEPPSGGPDLEPAVHRKLMSMLRGLEIDTFDHDKRVAFLSAQLGYEVTSSKNLSLEEVEMVIDRIRQGGGQSERD